MGKSDTLLLGLVEINNFFDFTLDGDSEGNKGDEKLISKGVTDAAMLGDETRDGSAPDVSVEEEEEELEWITNKDDFPPVPEFFFQCIQPPRKPRLYAQERECKLRNMQERKRKVDSDDSSPPLSPPAPVSGRHVAKRLCSHCKTEKSSQWREGPVGPKTLCNACGLMFKTGNLLPEYRPKSSPTFSSALHSNSRRKVVEMRKKKHEAFGGDT